MDSNDPVAKAAVQAIRTGDTTSLASGADPSARPGYSDQAPAEAAADLGPQRENLITWLHGQKPDQ